MAAPHPRPDGQRQARPGRDIPWTEIENAPRPGRVPVVPKWATLTATAKVWWDWAWKLPVARQWDEVELPMLVRRAQLEALWQETREDKLLAEMRHLEAALGMTPKARKELRWRMVDPAPKVAAAPRPRSRANLRVVDEQAS